MAMFSFGKKPKSGDAAPGAPGSPIEQIMAMQQQGMDTNMMVEELQKQGYNSTQIYEAINQSQMQNPGAPMGPPPAAGAQLTEAAPPPDMPPMDMPGAELPPIGDPEMPPPDAAPSGESNRELIEEISEAIIDEKWKEFEEDLRKIIEWKEQTEAHIAQITQQIQDVSLSVNSLHKNILNKISEYDRNIVDVGTEIKAMEKVFQKVLPSLTENVNKLERMTDNAPKRK